MKIGNIRLKRKIISKELIIALYYSVFIIFRQITQAHEDRSTLILFMAIAVLFAAYLYASDFVIHKDNAQRWLFVVLLVSFIFFISLFLNGSKYTGEYFQYFLIFGAVPMFFFINPVEYQKLLFLWAAVCEIVGVIFFYDPFNNYLLTGNYMVYGFDVMLPAFAGSIIMAFFYKRKIHLIYACAAFMLLLFGNKGALLTAIVLGISVYILVDGNIRKGRLLFVFSILYLSYLFRVQIFQKILFFFHSRGLNSYSLNTLYKIIDGQGGSVNSDRINLIRRGKRLFFQNPILGHGIGYYEEQAGFYVHNILWDILVMAGLIGMVLFIALFLRSLFCFRSYTKYQKNFYLIMMVMWIVPLMTSMTFWHWIPFWLYWTGYIFQHHTSNNYLKGEYNNG